MRVICSDQPISSTDAQKSFQTDLAKRYPVEELHYGAFSESGRTVTAVALALVVVFAFAVLVACCGYFFRRRKLRKYRNKSNNNISQHVPPAGGPMSSVPGGPNASNMPRVSQPPAAAHTGPDHRVGSVGATIVPQPIAGGFR
ncbi:hypothetical protein G7054_g1304 [Neopestalotiopsis clavispora]|nr:hypothetical protein G7054_g1304 [Neopestalotiopsis clavispora]